MEMRTKDRVILSCFFILVFIFLIFIYLKPDYYDETKVYKYENQNFDGINGFYNYGGYFCVETAERSATEIARTTMHEICHWYVDQNYEHFCNITDG